ncbi:hypothetical protein B4U80_07137 [Leptotrombidium deliense]|uniref:Pyroglutamyl-peptidase 1-like protein n=1 Tax=Leptotrombidium deliense TaxID=299467 RepID=A0A443SUM7_9ACAR|nr:hypothetical protein B4U80_07137 [Leptotrombidium deliense]
MNDQQFHRQFVCQRNESLNSIDYTLINFYLFLLTTKLVVHCGVSKMTDNLKIETKAFGNEYTNPDVNGCVPKCDTKVVDEQKCKCITTEINVKKVCEKVSQCCKNGNIKLDAQPSTNAGRYLCEYIYFASLNQNCRRTVFIHVPELSEQCSAADIAAAIKCSIEAILEEMCISAQNENSEKSALRM